MNSGQLRAKKQTVEAAVEATVKTMTRQGSPGERNMFPRYDQNAIRMTGERVAQPRPLQVPSDPRY